MRFHEYGVLFIFVCISTATFDFHRRGWLDKVVEYHKNKLFEDFRKVPDVEIKATIQPEPEGYVDSPAWDFESVTRLLVLISQSKNASPVRRALRRMLGNTRRKMSIQESFKYFPSLKKESPNNIYYDTSYEELYESVVTDQAFVEDKERGIIIVSNPVEARLPSAMISIDLLRNILEERAKAARYMPTTRRTIAWKSMSKTTPSNSSTTAAQNGTKPEDGGATSTGKPEANTGAATGATGNGTEAGAAATTAAN